MLSETVDLILICKVCGNIHKFTERATTPKEEVKVIEPTKASYILELNGHK